MVQDELDDFEANFHVDWFSGETSGGQDCFDPKELLVEMDWWRYIPLVNLVADGLNRIPMIPDRIEQLLITSLMSECAEPALWVLRTL